ncbi:MAG: glutaredoxin 3, partial [Deltaproteobacteria bacterium]|nr:glutaredoxin 3 [Deltaproteobacteria bacterium]
MAQVEIYTADYCSYCKAAKALLKNKGVVFQEIDVTHDLEKRAEIAKRSGQKTVPQIFINDQSIGGFSDLKA